MQPVGIQCDLDLVAGAAGRTRIDAGDDAYGIGIVNDGRYSCSAKDGTLALTMPSCKALHINAIVNDDTAIHDTQQHSWRWQRTGEGILLSGVAEGTVIFLYDTSGRMLKRIVANGQDIYLNTNGQQLLILKVGSESIILGRKGA